MQELKIYSVRLHFFWLFCTYCCRQTPTSLSRAAGSLSPAAAAATILNSSHSIQELAPTQQQAIKKCQAIKNWRQHVSR